LTNHQKQPRGRTWKDMATERTACVTAVKPGRPKTGIISFRWRVSSWTKGAFEFPPGFETRHSAGSGVPGDDSPVVWGQCGHAFHLQCITKWLTSQTEQRCPICRGNWEFAQDKAAAGGEGGDLAEMSGDDEDGENDDDDDEDEDDHDEDGDEDDENEDEDEDDMDMDEED
jgi:hypothetical protein